MVSMKGLADYGLVASSLQDLKFRESIRNIAEQPSVIMHVAEAGDGNTKEVNLVFIRPVQIIHGHQSISFIALNQYCVMKKRDPFPMNEMDHKFGKIVIFSKQYKI